MFKAIQTSVSGLLAATSRANVAASNIVNAQVASTPAGQGGAPTTGETFRGYTPRRTEQTTTPSGGVRAHAAPVNPASLTVYDPASPLASEQGMVNIPNVSLPAELAELSRASHAYKANAAVLKALDETFNALVKI